MSVTTLLSAVGVSGAGTTKSIDTRGRSGTVPVQVKLGTTDTVKVQGSLDGTNWVDLKTFTADGYDVIPVFPYMRGNVTVFTTGPISLFLLAKTLVV